MLDPVGNLLYRINSNTEPIDQPDTGEVEMNRGTQLLTIRVGDCYINRVVERDSNDVEHEISIETGRYHVAALRLAEFGNVIELPLRANGELQP